VEIQLPAAWDASRTYSVLSVRVDACGDHADQLRHRVAALLEGRADVARLLATVEAAILADAALRRQIAEIREAALQAAAGRPTS
jgi:hypothetical protein